MLKRVVSTVANLFVLMLYIQLVSSQLPSEQVSVMTRAYEIFQNDTAPPNFVWNITAKHSNPCSWKGVFCNSDNSSINRLSFSSFSVSTSEFLPFLCSVTTLESLDVSNNHLTSIPEEFYTNCGKISELKLLNFSNNKLTGSLPTFNGFIMLEHLDFSQNSLNGQIKLQLDGLGSLRSLNLSQNQFRGTVPANLGKMNLLEELRLFANSFTGEIPVEITKHRNLRVIDLSANDLSGSIPEELGYLTRLETLVLSLNKVGGRIPTSLSNITTLKRFAANYNNFNGTIPSGITSYLVSLDLSYNKLTGTIPSDLLSRPNLKFLDLSNNELQGPIPAINSTKLFRLRLGSNSLNGTIPSESLESLGELMYLELDKNNLSGEIPLGLGRCRKLALLNLAQNRLTGRLPPFLGDLTNLEVLSLQFNNFVGEIPPEISQLKRLWKLNISRNSLNGSIPFSISRLRILNNLDLQVNNLSGSIPDSIGSLSSLLELQLGKNQLSGRIPDMPPNVQIALNLSYNLFRGPIPVNLSKLSVLEVLDLSNNRFSGEIPDILNQLGSLNHLLLSNNDLSGVVPSFGVRVEVDIRGNNNLIVPRKNPSPPHRTMKSIDSDIVVAFASGMPVGILITIAILILRRHNRIHCSLLTPSSIYRSNIDFKKAMEAVAHPSNITLKTRFSTYYKAVMPSGSPYLVKKVNRSNKMFRLHSHERFGEELEDLGMLSNSNVMIPIAYVFTVHNAYLFYDFTPRCTLSYILHRRMGDPLDWASRYSIAVGLSRGLAFLHECSSGPIILLDLSSESILMKSPSEPQIGDIELCKLIRPSKTTCSISTLAGSVGCVPPEYGNTMRVTAKGNVYSFGVVLLELLTGKPSVSEGTEVAQWVLQRNKWDEMIDVSVSNTSPAVRSQMLAVFEVALACISISPETRPNMIRVLQMLNDSRNVC